MSSFMKIGEFKTDLSLIMKNARNKRYFALPFFFFLKPFGWIVHLKEHFTSYHRLEGGRVYYLS